MTSILAVIASLSAVALYGITWSKMEVLEVHTARSKPVGIVYVLAAYVASKASYIGHLVLRNCCFRRSPECVRADRDLPERGYVRWVHVRFLGRALHRGCCVHDRHQGMNV